MRARFIREGDTTFVKKPTMKAEPEFKKKFWKRNVMKNVNDEQ